MSFLKSVHKVKHHLFDTKVAADLGVYAAIIIENIDRFPNCPFKDLHKNFPYFPKDIFYEILKGLVEKGHLKFKEDSNES